MEDGRVKFLADDFESFVKGLCAVDRDEYEHRDPEEDKDYENEEEGYNGEYDGFGNKIRRSAITAS